MASRKTLICIVLLMIVLHVCLHVDCTSSDSAEKLKKQKDQKAVEGPFLSFKKPKRQWCPKIEQVFKMKTIAHRHIVRAIQGINDDKNITVEERTFHVDRFKNFERELNETEDQVVQSLKWLSTVLKGDYKDIITMHASSKKRLEALRDATMKEEQEYNAIIKDEEKLKMFNHSKVEGLLNEILNDVAKAANKLEADLDDHVFDNAMQNPDLAKGANIEAVIRLEEDDKESEVNTSTKKLKKEGGGMIKLVDAQDNQFVLARGKDTTVPHEDHHLIKDIVYVMVLSVTCGWISAALRFPSMFGYIIGGIILGPSGFNILKSLVQLETLGEFGVFFILFSVGLEFSPGKIRKVLKVAVLGSVLMMLVMILAGLGIGYLLKAQPNESSFVAACLSLSSTPLVVRFLNPGSNSQSDEGSTDYGVALIGILIMQDILLGILMALLPSMASSDVPLTPSAQTLAYLFITLRLAAALLGVVVISWALSRVVIGPLYKHLIRKGNNEITVLVTVTLAFLMLSGTDLLHVSMELGSFVAGVMISAQGPQLADQVERLVQPVKDYLGVLFFASIGLHVFPSFMVYEITYLFTFTILAVTAKFIISVAVLALLLPRSSRHVKWLVAAGLAQVSEFSFVLGSRARRLGLISREVYLLILSVTTLSLLMAPLLWRMSLWQLRIKGHTRNPEMRSFPYPSDAIDEENQLKQPNTKRLPTSDSRRRNLST